MAVVSPPLSPEAQESASSFSGWIGALWGAFILYLGQHGFRRFFGRSKPHQNGNGGQSAANAAALVARADKEASALVASAGLVATALSEKAERDAAALVAKFDKDEAKEAGRNENRVSETERDIKVLFSKYDSIIKAQEATNLQIATLTGSVLGMEKILGQVLRALTTKKKPTRH